jgi:DNA mismatch repair protein MutS2
LQLAERDEERRILAELSHMVASSANEITHTVDVIAELDLALACGKYSDDLGAVQPTLHELNKQTKDGLRDPGVVIRLYQARHPLLDPQIVVPIDVELDPQTYAMVITGPNTGGKTVALKTVGLLALMAQAGLHIPAQTGSALSTFETLFADIGDEQSIEQSLSTFSGHITNIIRIMEQADGRSLVILDELGAGTDPQEGSALARAILTHLVTLGITTLVTTHHPELKAFAHTTPGVVNASVEFDLETLRPTYRLTIGLPGRSNALAIAERLGLPDSIIANARAEIHPDDLRAEDLLDEILRQRDLSRQARSAVDQARQEAENLRAELFDRLDKIEDERRKVLEGARVEAAGQIEDLQEEITAARKALAKARQPVDVLKDVEVQAEALEEAYEQPVERKQATLGPEMRKMEHERKRAIRLGDKVRLRTLGAQGVVIALGQEEAEIQVGVMRVRAKMSDLELPTPSGAPSAVQNSKTRIQTPKGEISRPASADTGSIRSSLALPASPGIELDLRGKRADEALIELERYIDAAFLSGMPFVRIIHGKGTGKLREAVRQALHQNPNVKSFEGGGEKEGGEGVTVAKF